MSRIVSFVLNGEQVEAAVESRTLLVDMLRQTLGRTGTHVGCDTSQCGACVIHVDGRSVKSCTMLAVQAEGANVLTIEGVAANGRLHPMQEAFREQHGLQCGFCTPGFVTTVTAFLRDNPDPTEEEAREAIGGNLCRCTGYQNIVASVLRAAQLLREAR